MFDSVLCDFVMFGMICNAMFGTIFESKILYDCVVVMCLILSSLMPHFLVDFVK